LDSYPVNDVWFKLNILQACSPEYVDIDQTKIKGEKEKNVPYLINTSPYKRNMLR